MFELYSVSAKRTIINAQEEACSLGHPWIGTAHLLLGLVSTMPGTTQTGGDYRQHARLAVEAVGVEYEALRRAMIQAVGDHGPGAEERKKWTLQARTVLDNPPVIRPPSHPDGYIGTGQLLVALLSTKLVELPVPERSKWTRRQLKTVLMTPEPYDIGPRLLLDAVGSLERVLAAARVDYGRG